MSHVTADARARRGRCRSSRWEWRSSRMRASCSDGSDIVMSRAAIRAAQAIVADWNPSGYLWNSIDRVRLDVQPGPGVVMPAGGDSTVAVVDDGPGKKVLDTRCLACHDTSLISQQRLTIPGWTREVDKMIGWGAGVADEEKRSLIEYLAAHFGATR